MIGAANALFIYTQESHKQIFGTGKESEHMTFALKTFEQLPPITRQLSKYNQLGVPEYLYFTVLQRPTPTRNAQHLTTFVLPAVFVIVCTSLLASQSQTSAYYSIFYSFGETADMNTQHLITALPAVSVKACTSLLSHIQLYTGVYYSILK